MSVPLVPLGRQMSVPLVPSRAAGKATPFPQFPFPNSFRISRQAKNSKYPQSRCTSMREITGLPSLAPQCAVITNLVFIVDDRCKDVSQTALSSHHVGIVPDCGVRVSNNQFGKRKTGAQSDLCKDAANCPHLRIAHILAYMCFALRATTNPAACRIACRRSAAVGPAPGLDFVGRRKASATTLRVPPCRRSRIPPPRYTKTHSLRECCTKMLGRDQVQIRKSSRAARWSAPTNRPFSGAITERAAICSQLECQRNGASAILVAFVQP